MGHIILFDLYGEFLLGPELDKAYAGIDELINNKSLWPHNFDALSFDSVKLDRGICKL